MRALKARRGGGPELLAYKDDRGRWTDVRSADINVYLQDALGQDFSAKDFRTWTATVLAAVGLAAAADPDSGRSRAPAGGGPGRRATSPTSSATPRAWLAARTSTPG